MCQISKLKTLQRYNANGFWNGENLPPEEPFLVSRA